MLRQWLVPVLAIFAVAFLMPVDASAQLGKGGGKGDVKGGDGKGGSGKGDDKGNRGGGRNDDRGGKTSPPQKNDDKGGRTSPPQKNDDKGGKTSPPPKNNGGGNSAPPARNDDQLGKGGGGKGGGSTGGGGGSGGNGGGKSSPPVNKGGGNSAPPVKNSPPVNRGGGGQLGKGGSGNTGGSGGSRSGGSSGSGSLGRPTTGGQSGSGTLGRGGSTGSRGGSSTLDRGRPDVQERKPLDLRNDVFRKTQPSRSGNVTYGSKNNVFDRARSNNPPVRINEAPAVIRHSTRIERDVYREDRTVRHREFRSGYCHYNPWWVDDWFYYPHYVFHYNPGYCYPSPFYYYHHVPGYVASVRVITGNFVFVITAHERYHWRRPTYRFPNDPYYGGYGRYDYGLIDYQIDNLVTAFERRDVYYMQRMIPRNGYVHVALEETADYRMYSDDFYDMLADIVEGTDTLSYQITDVRYDRSQYVVYAEHEYRDPWGRIERKYHTIVMEPDREGYEIAYFRVDRKLDW